MNPEGLAEGKPQMIDFVELASGGCDYGQSCGFHFIIFTLVTT